MATLDGSAKVPKAQINLSAADVGAIAVETDPTVPSFAKGLSDSDNLLAALNLATGTILAARLPDPIFSSTKLATPRTIAATGDGTWSVSFDGSVNASAALTLATVNTNVGSFGSATQTPVITVDGKGRITAVSNTNITPAWSVITGKPTTLSGFGITDAQPLGNELTALQALADTAGFLRKTGNGAYSIDTSTYLPSSGGTISGTEQATSTTTGALRVPNGGASVGGNLYTGGFSYFGSALGLKAISLKGTTPATQGTTINIAHGLDSSKIEGVMFLASFETTGYWVPHNYGISNLYQITWSIDLTNISITTIANASPNVLSKPFRVLLFYSN